MNNKLIKSRRLSDLRSPLRPFVQLDDSNSTRQERVQVIDRINADRRQRLSDNTEEFERACRLMIGGKLLSDMAGTLFFEVFDIFSEYGLYNHELKRRWNAFIKRRDEFSAFFMSTIGKNGAYREQSVKDFGHYFPLVLDVLDLRRFLTEYLTPLEREAIERAKQRQRVFQNEELNDRISFRTNASLRQQVAWIAEQEGVSKQKQLNDTVRTFCAMWTEHNPEKPIPADYGKDRTKPQ